MQKWIEFKDGKFWGVWQGDVLEYAGNIVDANTTDSELFAMGLLRLTELPNEYANTPGVVLTGPIYELAVDGSANVTIRYDCHIHPFDEIKRRKLQELFFAKDEWLKDGVTYNGHVFDLRFRNIAYLSILATLITSGKYPEDFYWFDQDGNVVPLPADDCLGLIEAAANCIVDVEQRAIAALQELEQYTEVEQLLAHNIIIQ
jgi:hypothetical protein